MNRKQIIKNSLRKSPALSGGPRYGGPKGGRPQLRGNPPEMHYLAGRRKQKGRVVSPIKPGEFYPGTLGDRKTKGPQYA